MIDIASSTVLVEALCEKWDKKAVRRLSVGVGDHDLTLAVAQNTRRKINGISNCI
jgi:hypothetical protein